jgi:enoyl-CoA hydratase
VLSGATFAPDAALARGLVDEVAEPSGLLDRAVAAAQALAALAPPAFAATKRQIRLPVTERLAKHGEAIDAAAEHIWTAPETLEHIRDYVARTFKRG